MPYQLNWHVQPHVINLRFYGDVTEQEVINTGVDIQPLINQSVSPLFLVVDGRDVGKYPTNLKMLLEGMKDNSDNSSKLTWTLIITNNRFFNFIGTMVASVFHMPIRTCKTMEEVESLIAGHAPEIVLKLEVRPSS